MSCGQEEFVVTVALPGDSSVDVLPAIRPGCGPGVEECWMEMDGARMRYLRAGSGPPIILLHGLLGYSFSWRFTMPALAPYAAVYAPDLLGAGFSDRPAGIDCCLGATADFILQFIERLGISSVDLLGTSHGGAVAMLAAARCRDRGSPKVRRLILVAPVNPYSAHGRRLAPFLGTRLGSSLFRRIAPRMTFLFAYAHKRMYGNRNTIPLGTLEGYMAPLAIPGLFEHGLGIVRTWTADLEKLEAILPTLEEIPALLMWGSKDYAVYASSAAPLARHFRNAKVAVFRGIGHLPYEECPEEFNRELIEFLARPLPRSRNDS